MRADDEYEIEISYKRRDPTLVCPIDVTKAKLDMFRFERLPCDDQGTLSIAIAVAIADIPAAWSLEVLGYMPQPTLHHSADGKFEAYTLSFRSLVDATLFRVRFGHLF